MKSNLSFSLNVFTKCTELSKKWFWYRNLLPLVSCIIGTCYFLCLVSLEPATSCVIGTCYLLCLWTLLPLVSCVIGKCYLLCQRAQCRKKSMQEKIQDYLPVAGWGLFTKTALFNSGSMENLSNLVQKEKNNSVMGWGGLSKMSNIKMSKDVKKPATSCVLCHWNLLPFVSESTEQEKIQAAEKINHYHPSLLCLSNWKCWILFRKTQM